MAIGDLFSGLARLSPSILQGMTSGAANFQAQMAAQKQRQVLDAFRQQQLQFQRDQLAQQQVHQDRQAAMEEFKTLYADLSDEGKRYSLQQSGALDAHAAATEDAAKRAGIKGFRAATYLQDVAEEQAPKPAGIPGMVPQAVAPSPQLPSIVPRFIGPVQPLAPLPAITAPPTPSTPLAPPDINRIFADALASLQAQPEMPKGKFAQPAKEAAAAAEERRKAALGPLGLLKEISGIQQATAETKGAIGRERREAAFYPTKVAQAKSDIVVKNATARLLGAREADIPQRTAAYIKSVNDRSDEWQARLAQEQQSDEWKQGVAQTANKIHQGLLDLAAARNPSQIARAWAGQKKLLKEAQFYGQNSPVFQALIKATFGAIGKPLKLGETQEFPDQKQVADLLTNGLAMVNALRKAQPDLFIGGDADADAETISSSISGIRGAKSAQPAPSKFSPAQINAAGRALSDPGWRKQMEATMSPEAKRAFEVAIGYVKTTRGTKKGR